MPLTKVKTGWSSGNLIFYDTSNNIIATWDGTNRKLTFASGAVLDVSAAATAISLAASTVAKTALKAEITYNERVCCNGQFDNETISLGKVLNDCTVVAVSYWADQTLGSGAGIDIIDGGTDNNGSTVIDSCSANLAANTLDYNALSTPYALSAGDYLKVVCDNFTYATNCVIQIVLEVPLRTVA